MRLNPSEVIYETIARALELVPRTYGRVISYGEALTLLSKSL